MGGSGDAHRLTVHRRSQLGCAASPAGVYEHLCLLPSDLQQVDVLMIVYVIELSVLATDCPRYPHEGHLLSVKLSTVLLTRQH